jgi:hypothetical protein
LVSPRSLASSSASGPEVSINSQAPGAPTSEPPNGQFCVGPGLACDDVQMLLDELQKRLPPESIQVDVDVIEAYSQDRAVFESAGTASILVMPGSTAEVVAAVEAANAADVPIVPRGAGTGLTGAANAVDGCMILSLHRMDQILEIDTTNRNCRVQPGVINADLKAAVAEQGLFYPPDPASFDMSSIGGNVATNAGGLCCVKYGVTRDYVMGLEVVMASGEVMRTGRKTIKSTTGLDLTGCPGNYHRDHVEARDGAAATIYRRCVLRCARASGLSNRRHLPPRPRTEPDGDRRPSVLTAGRGGLSHGP